MEQDFLWDHILVLANKSGLTRPVMADFLQVDTDFLGVGSLTVDMIDRLECLFNLSLELESYDQVEIPYLGGLEVTRLEQIVAVQRIARNSDII